MQHIVHGSTRPTMNRNSLLNDIFNETADLCKTAVELIEYFFHFQQLLNKQAQSSCILWKRILYNLNTKIIIKN